MIAIQSRSTGKGRHMEASDITTKDLAAKAAEIRRQTLEIVLRVGKGHLGGAFSATEILVALFYGGIMRFDPKDPEWQGRDRFILSKAHSSNTLHYILSDLGFIPPSDLDAFLDNGTFIGGHLDHLTPGIEITGGSLGHGLSVGAGMALGLRESGGSEKVFVIIGDGESQEGSIWEAAIFARQHQLDNLIAVTDYNGLGSEDYIRNTGDLSPLEEKWRAFGWNVSVIDGHDMDAVMDAFSRSRRNAGGQPTMIIAKTIKGKGMSTHENLPKSHHTLPRGEEINQVRRDLGTTGIAAVPATTGPSAIQPDAREAIFGALYDAAVADPKVVVLTTDTGAMKFRDFVKDVPEQLINVGISEQNAIGAAAGLALTGHRVFVYGITGFVTLRVLEQIKVDICCMGLPVTIVGLGTGYAYSFDGPTHHIVEDIAVMRALPGLSIWSPSDIVSAARSIDLALACDGPGYIRFDKGPFDALYEEDDDFSAGISRLRDGADATVIATGIMTTQAMRVAERLRAMDLNIGVIDAYRLQPLNCDALLKILGDTPRIFTLEEHFLDGGLGSIVAEAISSVPNGPPLTRLGIAGGYYSEVGDREYMRSLDRIDQNSLVDQLAGFLRS